MDKTLNTPPTKTLAEIKKELDEYTFKHLGNGKCKCICGGEFLIKYKAEHKKRLIHTNYFKNPLKIQEIALPLPTISAEMQEIPNPDNEPEEIAEIPSSVPDTVLTKAEIRKQKKKEYMRNYMKDYHTKRYNEDPAYRQYRIDMTKKSTCKMSSRYVKAYQYMKENGINIFDENGN